MIKYIVEGTSSLNMDEAMTGALRGAAEHLSENNDILVSLVERKALRGGACHVRLEVTTLPPGAQGRDRAPAALTAKQIAADRALQAKRAEAATAWKKRIVDHFRKRMGVEIGASTRMHLENLSEFAIMGEIEREFFNRSHAVLPPRPPEKLPETLRAKLDSEKPE